MPRTRGKILKNLARSQAFAFSEFRFLLILIFMLELCSSLLQGWEPEANPLVWLGVNAVCLFGSVVVLALALSRDKKGHHVARQSYLAYNLLTSLVWWTEVSLPVISRGLTALRGIWAKIELLVALYFLVDSVIVVNAWRLKKDHTASMVEDTAVNLAAYLYMVVLTGRTLWKRREYEHISRNSEA